MDPNIAAKVHKYESFLNDNLKEDLKFLESKLKIVNEKLSNWYLLKKSVNNIRESHPKGFKMLGDVGCGILCQVNVHDPSVINVNVGLNVYLTMTLEEADKYCDMRIKLLKKEIEHIQKQSIKVKAHIKIVLLGLKELQNIL